MTSASSGFRNQHFAAQGLGCCLAQHLPGSGGVALANCRERCPEVVASGCSLHVGCGHLHLRTLVGRRCRCKPALVGLNLSCQTILCKLSGVRALRTEELVDVLSEHIRVGQQRVIRGVVLGSGFDHRVGVLQLLLNGLQLAHHLSSLLSLGQQGILHHTGVAIQQGRGLSAEVLKNLKTFVADALEILVARGCARRAAVARSLCLNRLGIGLRLWER